MRRMIFGIFVVCFGCTQAMATDATWFCSAVLGKADKKPTAFKFEVKGGELIDSDAGFDAFFKQWEIPKNEPTKYTIVEETDKVLVAVHSYGFDKASGASAIVVLIDKASNEFRETIISAKGGVSLNVEGTCQLGK